MLTINQEEQLAREIGYLIRDVRKMLHLKQADVAIKAGVTQTYLSLIETGKKIPALSVIKAIAESMDCDMNITFNPRIFQEKC